VVEFGNKVDQQLSTMVLSLARELIEAAIPGVLEAVPTFRSLMVHYDPAVIAFTDLIEFIDAAICGIPVVANEYPVWKLPVCYDSSVAPDLTEIASSAGLPPSQIIERHCAPRYHVYMLGFLPGQAYMGDLPEELAFPRRQSPRSKIAAGSVAIAMNITCIFPQEGPCGWHIIGRSPVRLWEKGTANTLLTPGDKVMFTPVSLPEYEILLAKVSAGEHLILQDGVAT
jgi:KipI family sensor histidine kinase inhibitor